MRDDTEIDDLLTAALAAPAPQPSSGFHAGVMRRVTHRRASPASVAVLVAYALGSGMLCAWLLRDVPPALLGLVLAAGAGAAILAGTYASTIAGVRRAIP
jgi:hypothetical protein